MDARDIHLAALAAALREDEGRIRSYVSGKAIPRPEMLKKLTAHTGLPSDAFLFPFEWKPVQREAVA